MKFGKGKFFIAHQNCGHNSIRHCHSSGGSGGFFLLLKEANWTMSNLPLTGENCVTGSAWPMKLVFNWSKRLMNSIISRLPVNEEKFIPHCTRAFGWWFFLQRKYYRCHALSLVIQGWAKVRFPGSVNIWWKIVSSYLLQAGERKIFTAYSQNLGSIL